MAAQGSVAEADALLAELASTGALLMILMCRFDEAMAISRAVFAQEGASDLARLQALTATLLVMLKIGRLREADRLRARHGAWVERTLLEHPYGVVQRDVCRFLSRLYGGRFRAVADDFERRHQEALGRRAPGWVTGNLAAVAGPRPESRLLPPGASAPLPWPSSPVASPRRWRPWSSWSPQAGLLHQVVRLDAPAEVLGPLERLAEDCDTPLVATLAARRLSNREIADRLVVSLRTVDSHLHHSYMKLGGRDALAAILLVGPAGDGVDSAA